VNKNKPLDVATKRSYNYQHGRRTDRSAGGQGEGGESGQPEVEQATRFHE
jgi:hypothetical protein